MVPCGMDLYMTWHIVDTISCDLTSTIALLYQRFTSEGLICMRIKRFQRIVRFPRIENFLGIDRFVED